MEGGDHVSDESATHSESADTPGPAPKRRVPWSLIWGGVAIVVLAALAVLLVEWMVYERDTLVRLRRRAAARLRGDDGHHPGRAA